MITKIYTLDTTEATKIFIVDDHPMTVDGYVSLLSSTSADPKEFFLSYSCKEAYDQISVFQNLGIKPDIAFIDLNLPPYEEQNIFSGTDIAVLVREIFPDCKMVIISMHKEPVWVNRIMKSISPEGFISKNDINYETFPEVYTTILADENFVSPSIVESQKLFIRKNIQWDEYDSKILQLLSEGIKTRNLPNYIALSLSTIEKRKANIKRQIMYDNGSDKELIEAARDLGLI